MTAARVTLELLSRVPVFATLAEPDLKRVAEVTVRRSFSAQHVGVSRQR